jgi:excisionase family DNA binding protein
MTCVGRGEPELDTLLSVEQAAERLGTSVRFVRRLVFERRIAYAKLGCHVRIASGSGDLDAFIEAGRVEAAARPDAIRRGA